jgi:hypothetical protein
MSEVVLSFGSYANRLTTHFFNMQSEVDDYDRQKLFMTSYKKGYPRVLQVDYRRPFVGDIQRRIKEGVDWGYRTVVVDRSLNEEEMDVGQQDEVEATQWTEPVEEILHPKSLAEVPLYSEDSKQFRSYFTGYGDEIVTAQSREDLNDRIRSLVEECSSLGTILVAADLFDGFSGLAARALEEIHDEYGSTTVSVLACEDPELSNLNTTTSETLRSYNAGLFYANITDVASLLVPLHARNTLHVDNLLAQDSSYLNRSAYLLAVAWEGATCILRRSSLAREYSAAHLINDATCRGRLRVCSLEAALPLDPSLSVDRFAPSSAAYLNPFTRDLSIPISLKQPKRQSVFANVLTIRGPSALDQRSLVGCSREGGYLLTRCQVIADALHRPPR